MKYLNLKHLTRTGIAVSIPLLGAGSSAWAQATSTCAFSLSYVPAIVPGSSASAVPSLTFIGIATLGLFIAGIAWRNRNKAGMNRILTVVGLTAAASFIAIGGSPLVNTVRAAGPFELSAPSGGTLAEDAISIPSTDTAQPLVVTNTSGVLLRITAVSNPNEAGTCSVGTQLAPGASCTVLPTCSGGEGGGGGGIGGGGGGIGGGGGGIGGGGGGIGGGGGGIGGGGV